MAIALLLGLAVLAPVFAARPARTILPLYAASVPAGSVIAISLPLPAPFNTLSSVLGAAAILAVVAHLVLYRRGRVPDLPVALWLVMVGWVGVTAFWTIDFETTAETVVLAWPLALLLVAVAFLPTDEADLDAVRLAVIASGIAIGAYLLMLMAIGQPLVGQDERFAIAAGSAENDPNILAASLLLPLALSLERLVLGGSRWISDRAWRLLGGAGALLLLIAITTTGSRGGLLATVVLLVVALVAASRIPEARRHVKRAVLGIAVVAAGVTVFTVAALRIAPQGTVATLVNNPPLKRLHNLEIGGSGRVEIWATGLQLCRAHCAVGSGVRTFAGAFDEVFPFSGALVNIGPNLAAHSIYLELAVEAGLIGLTLLGLAFAAELRLLLSRRLMSVAPGLGAALLAVLVANLFLSTLWFKYFWLVLVVARLATGAERARRRMPEAQPARV